MSGNAHVLDPEDAGLSPSEKVFPPTFAKEFFICSESIYAEFICAEIQTNKETNKNTFDPNGVTITRSALRHRGLAAIN